MTIIFEYNGHQSTINLEMLNKTGPNYFTGLINFNKLPIYYITDIITDENIYNMIISFINTGFFNFDVHPIKDSKILQDLNDAMHVLCFEQNIISNALYRSLLTANDQIIKKEEDDIREEQMLNYFDNNILIDLFSSDINLENNVENKNYRYIDLKLHKSIFGTVNSVEEFFQNVNILSYDIINLIPIDEKPFDEHLLIAGGFPLASLLLTDNYKTSGIDMWRIKNAFESLDLDIFLYNTNSVDANIMIKNIINIMQTRNSYLMGNKYKFIVTRTEYTVTVILSHNVANNYQGRRLSNFDGTGRKNFQIQFILRIYANPCQILSGFDIDASAIGFNAFGIYALPRFIRSIKHQYILLDPDRESSSYTYRLIKYSIRGFRIAVPQLYLNSHIYTDIDELLLKMNKNTNELHGVDKLLKCEIMKKLYKPYKICGCLDAFICTCDKTKPLSYYLKLNIDKSYQTRNTIESFEEILKIISSLKDEIIDELNNIDENVLTNNNITTLFLFNNYIFPYVMKRSMKSIKLLNNTKINNKTKFNIYFNIFAKKCIEILDLTTIVNNLNKKTTNNTTIKNILKKHQYMSFGNSNMNVIGSCYEYINISSNMGYRSLTNLTNAIMIKSRTNPDVSLKIIIKQIEEIDDIFTNNNDKIKLPVSIEWVTNNPGKQNVCEKNRRFKGVFKNLK